MFLSIYVNRVRIFLRVERGRNMKFVHLTKDEFDSFEEKCPDSTFWQTSAMVYIKKNKDVVYNLSVSKKQTRS